MAKAAANPSGKNNFHFCRPMDGKPFCGKNFKEKTLAPTKTKLNQMREFAQKLLAGPAIKLEQLIPDALLRRLERRKRKGALAPPVRCLTYKTALRLYAMRAYGRTALFTPPKHFAIISI